MRKFNKKTVAIAATTIALVAVGGAAFAYWTTGGAGVGQASTATGVQDVTVIQTSVISDLRPGAAPQILQGTFLNPNAETVHVNTVTVSISDVVDADGDTVVGCDATDYVLAANPMTVDLDAAVNDTSTWSGATIAFNNKAVNQDACKGATVELAYDVE